MSDQARRCPVDGCSYTGSVDSVEAHVSSMTDEPHEGLTGSSVREQIEESATEVVEEADGTPVAGAGLGAAAAGLGTMASADGDGLSTGEIVLAVAGLAVVVYLLTSPSTSGRSRTRSEEEKQGGSFGPMA